MSIDRLEREAERLATEPTMKAAGRGRALGPRIRDNGRVLLRCYRTLAKAIRDQATVAPAAVWLVDNFHTVDTALRLVRSDLPRGFYRALPKLASGALAGYSRLLALMDAFVAHTDSGFDASTLRRFLGAFQRVEPLTIGELWAVPTALRVVLLENLRRLAEGIAVPPVQGRGGQDPKLAAADVTVRNIITSLRALATFEWAAFFESVSPVDEALRKPAATTTPWTFRAGIAIATRSRTCPAARVSPSWRSPDGCSIARPAPPERRRASACRQSECGIPATT